MTRQHTNESDNQNINHIYLLPLFYSFPPEIVARSEFFDLPRSFRAALTDAQTMERIQSKQFLKDMAEMTANIPSPQSDSYKYSTRRPCVIIDYEITFYFSNLICFYAIIREFAV